MDRGARRYLMLLGVLVAILVLSDGKKSKSRFSNIKCETFNKTFAEFETCKLKLLGRGIIGTQVHLKLYILPIDTVSANLSIWRRYNSFQPFLHNSTIDFCKFVKQTKKLSFERLVLDAISSRSNLNHSCPYTHDIIVDNLVFSDTFLQTLPLPQGEYKIQMLFGTENIWRIRVDIFILRDE
ncbi:uncharacterized protein LOC133840008 [Drosophila sulfurigaster albostrigata]|uniref:uncharacterized protein LOC133840008 n=1 Tax=Drosophila sulfurigaster albostrigata TaxID=89887 RepID=UPI002D21B3E0|nr:uncharacterized protein LOC133840008 [Drosophila sulfurigaster albostrigata]